MNKIPTAEEILKTQPDDFEYKTVHERMKDALIQFAKLHVKAALEEAAKGAKIENIWEGNTGSEYCDTIVNKDSILNAYPLDNIK